MCGPQSPLSTESQRMPFVKVEKEVPRRRWPALYDEDDTFGTSTIAAMKYVEDLHLPGQVRGLCGELDGLEWDESVLTLILLIQPYLWTGASWNEGDPDTSQEVPCREKRFSTRKSGKTNLSWLRRRQKNASKTNYGKEWTREGQGKHQLAW